LKKGLPPLKITLIILGLLIFSIAFGSSLIPEKKIEFEPKIITSKNLEVNVITDLAY